MLIKNEKEVLRVILSGDKRQWLSLADGFKDKEIHLELIFRSDAIETDKEYQDLRSLLRELNLVAKVEKDKKVLLEKSLDASDIALTIISVTITLAGPWLLRGAKSHGRKLLKAIRKASGNMIDTDYDEILVRDSIDEWLDKQYGEGNWEVEIHEMSHKPIENIHVVDFVEKLSGRGHRLAIRKGTYEIEELDVKIG